MKSINFKVHPLVLAAAFAVAVPAIAIAAGTVLTPPVTATGASTAPILSATNNGAGPGLEGVSAQRKGVIGSTKFNSTSSAYEQAGVLGQDLSSAYFNAGVRGSSNDGTGVVGSSTNGTGVNAASGSGTAVTATGSTGLTVNGPPNAGGILANGGSIGVWGQSNGFAAVEGIDGFVAISSGGLMYEGNGSSGNDVFQVDDNGNVYAHSFNATLSPNVIQPKSSGGTVTTYSGQQTSPSVEDAGEGVMVAGSATVSFDRSFPQIIDHTAGYSVFVTPEGDNRGLFVTQKSPVGFTVRESQGGRSTLAFAYRVVARPFGNHGQRLPMVIQRSTTRLIKHMPQSPLHSEG